MENSASLAQMIFAGIFEKFSLDFPLLDTTIPEKPIVILDPLLHLSHKSFLSRILHTIPLLPPSCFHLNITSEDQILVGEEYTGLSIFDKAIGKIKDKLGGIIRKEFNPSEDDLLLQNGIDAISHYMSATMDSQDFPDIVRDQIISEDVSNEDALTPTILDTINNAVTNIKNKLENKIKDRRVFNGRKAENHLCESFTDSQIIDMMQRTHMAMYGREICVSPLLNKFLVCFQEALFKWIKENKKFDYIVGKIAHYNRMVIDTVGKYIGSGVRNIQKLIDWFHTKLEFSSSKTIWECKEEDKMREWQDCSSEIYDYLCVELPLIAEPD